MADIFALTLMLAVMLFIILVAATLFTNALEYLGERLNISEGVTGSLFAAVGTALPETMVPLLVILMGNEGIHQDVGIGSIIGAPLMLSTLSISLVALTAFYQRGIKASIQPERSGNLRDIIFFLIAFVFSFGALFVPVDMSYLRKIFSIILVLLYGAYIVLTLRASKGLVESGHATKATDKRMWLCQLGLSVNLFTIILQLLLGLGLLIIGAKGFIYGVETISYQLKVSALFLSLLIIPIATELPEKVNSILWIIKKKDTLALGNITGAMVFQGTLLPALGIAFTSWQPKIEVVACMLFTLVASLWLWVSYRANGFAISALLVNGLLYLAYIISMLLFLT